MNTTNFFQNRKYIFLLLGIVFLIISISLTLLIVTTNLPKKTIAEQTSLLPPEVYYNALKDAEEAKPEEIYTKLTAIVKDNPMIQWQGDLLKVATFTNHKYEVGSTEPQPVDLWVTVVPELKNFCTGYDATGENLVLRLEQLLGLPPSHKKSKNIVEFWVAPQDIFRPTPDPEITDREAELEFRQSNNFLIVSEEYKDWYNNRLNEFNSQLKDMKPDKIPFPWTRLGYTYDWGESENHIGLSEFVVRKGADIEIDSVSTVNEYCQANAL
ncbi:MAG: hypothetical protein QNJ34_10625 [Xenococcaceae cyanobacterium MO_188.B29]|nr:hypothetical protein [Xenococcaceae cyanobacterium MO_188.B29]